MPGPSRKALEPVVKVPIGYAWIIEKHQLAVLPPQQLSYVSRQRRIQQSTTREGLIRTVYPASYAPGPTLFDHLEFAFKQEDLNLEVLSALFHRVERRRFEAELTRYVRSRPTGKSARRLWFLYEFLTGRRLGIPDVKMGNYVPLLDPERYYTARPIRSRRHRVLDNLLGNARFCPLVRRTQALRELEGKQLKDQASKILEGYDEDAIRRAVSYLYTKETRSSFEIEREKPSPQRTERFVALLRSVPHVAALSEAELVRLQNEIVEPRFASQGYRQEQVYIGEAVGLGKQHYHYIAPRPEDVPDLMKGWIECLERLSRSEVDPIVQAAVVSFGFVFIHPFPDGNGRLHRLLIHYILARAEFTPGELIFPISAVMLNKKAEYDACLESFSRPLMPLIEWEEEAYQSIAVQNDTAGFYRYIEYTRMAEDLYRWTEETLRTEFRTELDFIVHFRKAREEMAEIVDLPDQLAQLFVQFCLQNNGRLSDAKRRSHFHMLEPVEIGALEHVVRNHLLELVRTKPA